MYSDLILDFRGNPKPKDHIQVLYLGLKPRPLLRANMNPKPVIAKMMPSNAGNAQSGASTHHQDQLMTPDNLRETNINVKMMLITTLF